eukprot:m.71585 g.71585  ORF g.71585 m.71585 type:complete len:304 (+) comp14192_c0_seq3:52-963(+)
MPSVEVPDELVDALVDATKPLTDRFRTLFTLRNLGGPKAIDAISQCFVDTSALFKHECAYCLGQMQDEAAVPVLTKVLEDEQQDVMVRHEAGEALGAIGAPQSKPILEHYSKDSRPEIAETCQIALERLGWVQQQSGDKSSKPAGPYKSVDPAPPVEGKTTDELRDMLMDTKLSLFQRYRALFALRNRGGEDAVLAIVEGLNDKSALFRHEIAYVLGQMQHPASADGLTERLVDGEENEMVRHECAEALGSIASEKTVPLLKKFLTDPARVVSESCVVALDIHEYETSGDFQYADSLAKLAES